MKTRYTLLLLLNAFVFLCFTSCDGRNPFNKCSGNEPDAYEEIIVFTLHDKDTNDMLLGLYGKYHKDTVKIYDENQEIVFDGPVETNGIVTFNFVNEETDQEAFQKQLTKYFYLYLDHTDTDTIKVDFQLYQDKCQESQFEFYEVYYNNDFYYDQYNGSTKFLKG